MANNKNAGPGALVLSLQKHAFFDCKKQRTNALALSLRHRLSNDLLMEFTGGLASRDNADFVSGASKKNKFVGWSISQRF